MLATVGFAFIAGILSILSPCVLPLLPIVIGAAASQHRLGPLALSCGLAISFTAIGILVATVGFAVGLDASLFRTTAAILLVIIGAVLLVPAFQARFALAASPIGAWTENRFGGFSTEGWIGQFGVGLLPGHHVFKYRQGQVLHHKAVSGQFLGPGLAGGGFIG